MYLTCWCQTAPLSTGGVPVVEKRSMGLYICSPGEDPVKGRDPCRDRLLEKTDDIVVCVIERKLYAVFYVYPLFNTGIWSRRWSKFGANSNSDPEKGKSTIQSSSPFAGHASNTLLLPFPFPPQLCLWSISTIVYQEMDTPSVDLEQQRDTVAPSSLLSWMAGWASRARIMARSNGPPGPEYVPLVDPSERNEEGTDDTNTELPSLLTLIIR
ncbi:hypothetical protein TREMEDRAFT_60365 [Tremella mesenterica DSM 1558]|uniref:uncharacterized protein n=1 Tax=Tremella mesenterica (strain ATCC 24925 / CBS 8224 / DSM 1558 / NBRC 9311 / NRRL Y-6157 / RJB 2259-6 / UBC 559-6) TaxID=578456 RepID=UPI0003F490BE|nr:uncharacterized protein TREMEDRAFT_60365 [Tremella mesenterica DSM 1558]EIW71436.1 hypothetical protein TREMEDRAFT_60365 [Tremella mesenterica DSM 1558]